ncbi:Phosphoesterase [Planctomycetales bacterium 10988]|nr:Phosphoesterase [Planctomycetales bacterium 10988]
MVVYIGVLSDTHGHVANTLAATRLLKSFELEFLIHCGDIGSEHIPDVLSDWTVHYVFGNVDSDLNSLRYSIEKAGGICHGEFGEIEVGEQKIAFMHSHDARRFQQVSNSGQYDLLCYGHTHQKEHHRVNKTLILNPGALFRAASHTLAIVELPQLEITTLTL